MSSSPHPPHPPHLRFLTLNFFIRPPPVAISLSTGDYKSERLRLFAQTQFENYDIIAFQELFASGSKRRDECVTLAREKGFMYEALCPKMPWWGGRVDAGLVILSRFKVEAVEHCVFGRGTELGDWLAAKGILYAKILLPTSTPSHPHRLHLFTTHFQSCDTPAAINIRRTQFSTSKSFMDATLLKHHSPHPTRLHPILYVGDMNVDGRVPGDESGKAHGWEWTLMMEVLEGRRGKEDAEAVTPVGGSSALTLSPGTYNVDDVCYMTMGHHPITTSVLTIGPDGHTGDRKCIDFILSYRFAGEGGEGTLGLASGSGDGDRAGVEGASSISQTEGTKKSEKRSVGWNNVRVERFAVSDQPFSFLSDHFGVAADIVLDEGEGEPVSTA